MYTLTNLQPKFKIFYSFYYRKFSERISGYASLCLRIHEEKPRNLKFLGFYERRRPDLNRWILVLQTIALPLGYCATMTPTGIEPVLPP
jgi:hypothetical protein